MATVRIRGAVYGNPLCCFGGGRFARWRVESCGCRDSVGGVVRFENDRQRVAGR